MESLCVHLHRCVSVFVLCNAKLMRAVFTVCLHLDIALTSAELKTSEYLFILCKSNDFLFMRLD